MVDTAETLLAPDPMIAAPEPIRVVIPSPLGGLGVELLGEAVRRLVIAPSRRERATYTPLKNAELTDFLDEALGRLSEYFAGARRDIGLAYDLGWTDYDEFTRRVLDETTKIPYGTTRTYRKLASAAGRGSAYRAVRAILMANPLPIIIPCHRVVPQKAGAGTYIGGTRKKEWLLRLERRFSEGR